MFGELRLGKVLLPAGADHVRRATAPALDQAGVEEHLRQGRIAWPRCVALAAQVLEPDAFRQAAGVPHLNRIFTHAYLDFAQRGVVAVNQGVYHRLPECIKRVLPDFFPLQTLHRSCLGCDLESNLQVRAEGGQGCLELRLRYLETRDEAMLKCPIEVELRLAAVAQQVPSVDNRPSLGRRASFDPDELAVWFRTPCMLGNRLAIPLEPMKIGWPYSKPCAIIDDVAYAEGRGQRPLFQADYVAHVRNMARQALQMRAGGNENRVSPAEVREHEYEEVLAPYHPQPQGAYAVVYAGGRHQLQYRCGHFVLIRGPVSPAQGPPHGSCPPLLYVGLPIRGQSRRDRLAGTPHRAATPSGVWSADGTPSAGNMCIGNRQQFTHLLSDRLTDAEALVLFLDAAVRIASGRAGRGRLARALPVKPASTAKITLPPRPAVATNVPVPLTESSCTLSIDWLAWEKCVAVAEVLARRFGASDLEYALLGAADARDPHHVTTMVLLRGQEVAPDAVRVSGRQVLAADSELRKIGQKQGARLVPVVFVHRHLGGCAMSATDVEFLNSVFIDQVATVHPSPQNVPYDAVGCGCPNNPAIPLPHTGAFARTPRVPQVRSVVGFSLIVNSTGEFAIHGARKLWCWWCGRSRVEAVSVQLALVGARSPTTAERTALRTQLEQEVSERIRLPGTHEYRPTR